jgi:hypothetical protein
LSKFKLLTIILTFLLMLSIVLPVLAAAYNPGVTAGQFVKYGNFVGVGPGAESFNDYDWLNLQVMDVSGKEVTFLSTSQFKNGTAISGNGTISVWNVETGTEDGVPKTQGPIIASNLNQGDPIPPYNTYTVNRTETRVYLGNSRSVNILDASGSTPDYTTTLNYVYDKASGMLLESSTQTTTQDDSSPVTTTISYNIIDTNIFEFKPSPSPSIPEFPITIISIIVLLGAVTAVIFSIKKKAIEF